MADKILLSPEQMRSTASTFTSGSTAIGQELETLSTAVDLLVENWEGVSGEAFYTDFKEYQTACNKMIDCLMERADLLNKSATQTEEYDQGLANAWS